MSLEKQIADKIFRVAVNAAQSKPINEEQIASEILHLVREALLEDEPVIAAVEAIRTSPVLDMSSYHRLPPEGPGPGEPGAWIGHELRREWRDYVGRASIAAAMSTAMKEV